MDKGLLILAPGLADEDWEAAEFAKMLCEAVLTNCAGAIAVVPQEGLAIACAGEILSCRTVALGFGMITEQLVSLVREYGLTSTLVIGDLSSSIVQALCAEGMTITQARFTDALADPGTPEPPPAPFISLTCDEARAMVGASNDREIEVAFPAVGTEAAMAAIAALSEQTHEQRRTLVLAGEWDDSEMLRQEAELLGLTRHVSFCGPVPANLRWALLKAASHIHLPPPVGAYRGEAGRIAASLKIEADGASSPVGDNLRQWAQWALRDRPAPAPGALTRLTVAGEGVAIFLPSRGCREWLPGAIEGMTGQTHDTAHVFVCADGGEDIDGELLAMFPQVSFLATTQAIGPYAIANALMAATASEYIAFQDADDISDLSRLSAQLAALNRLRLDGVGTNSRVIGLNGELIGVEIRPAAASLAMREHCADLLLHPTSLFRRRVLEGLGGFDSSTHFGADSELHFRAALTHRLGNVPELLYTRRERPQSLTRSRQTGFGSDARRQYSVPHHAAFKRMLESGETAKSGHTLIGRLLTPPQPGMLRAVRMGEGCDRWMSQRAAQILAY